MEIIRKISPSFSGNGVSGLETARHRFNYLRIWRMAVLLTGGVAIIPLAFITIVNYEAMQHAMVSEFLLRTTRIVSNTQRAISFFLTERKSAMDFIVHDNSFETLSDRGRLLDILENLKTSFGGGFVDLGVIDSAGYQRNYVGPYSLTGKRYSEQAWFNEVKEEGVHISDVFLGYRNVPHLVVAVKGFMPDGDFYVLRAALSIAPFEHLVSNLELCGMGDAFMVNHEGVLQTPSRYHGNVLQKMTLPVPSFSEATEVLEYRDAGGRDLIIGYRYIDDSPFVLMVVKRKNECMKQWNSTRLKLIAFLVLSMSVILTVILGTATFMVKKIKAADEKRIFSFHQLEYSNKMASLGRLAASVAHEINNPLAIINEKAGLMKDLFLIREAYQKEEKLLNIADSILGSVKRAGTITKRLLGFARNLQASIESLNVKEVVQEVLGFMGKEAELRSIEVTVDIPDEIPSLESDRGKIQQIFLNIVNNAFAAVDEGGRIDISARPEPDGFVTVSIADNGCGIPVEERDHIFEPFYTTKGGQGGTGLGLSITYNLVQEIGGVIDVESEPGKGTSFTISIPLKRETP